MEKLEYIIDDSLSIPEYLKKMSKEELKEYIEKLESKLFGDKSKKAKE